MKNKQHKSSRFKTGALFALALLATTGISYAASSTLTASNTVNVSLWDAGADMTMSDTMRIKDHPDLSKAAMGIKVSKTNFTAGEITFKVTNDSKIIEHEMVIARLKDTATGLAYDLENDAVNEDVKGMNIDEVAELAPGKSGSLTLNLEPGQYVLYCNVTGHYASGMWTLINVKSAIAPSS